MQCPQCQHENRDGAKFCEECGARLVHICPHGGHEVSPRAKFCEECATPLAGYTSSSSPALPTRCGADAESRFYALIRAVMWMLQSERRLTYRELKWTFGIDDALLHEVQEELVLRQVATDEGGKVLVWIGEAISAAPSITAITPSLAPPEAAGAVSSVLSEPTSSSMTTDTRHDVSSIVEPVHMAPEAERRQLTVMFCDLTDSTKLSQQLDPEDLREVIRAYQQTSAEVIERFDGHIAQHLGDGLLIYFGWPRAHEDDAQRAAHAGLGIVEAITTTLNPRLEAEKSVQLTVRMGVHTGPVVVGEMGGGGRHEHLATGETVNIASRLEGLAAPNTVVISQVTARLVRDAFALEDLGLHELKGVAEPMPVFRVLGPLETHEDETVVTGGPFLVGRDEEVGLLLRRWEQSKEGLGQVILLGGEAGIGKSSLVATVRHHVVAEGYTRMTFRCSPYHTNSALYPVIEHVQRVLQFQPGDTPATKLDKLERVLGGYSRPLEEVVPLYAALLSVSVPEGRYPALNMTPQKQRQQTQDALVGWLLEEAERQPTLAIWEDLHWADPSTLEMLGLIVEQAPTAPMLHVLTFRPEFESSWPTRSHLTPITLNRLERPQVEALITHLARGKALPSEVVEHIVAKTDGVPLYVEELTKMLLASDLLQEEADQYVLTGSLLTVAIPDTLQDSLMARLDQLNTAKEIAQLGTVLGREFSYEILQGVSSQNEETVQAGLAQLVEAELLYQRGRPPRARYLFKHALIQDAAYASLLRSTRQQVHEQIAQQLEEKFAETAETQPELLAHHYTEAGRSEQAIACWQRAGQRANEHSAHVEAAAHLSRGLEVLATLPQTPEHTQREIALRLALGPALMATKGIVTPEVKQLYDRTRTLCQQVEDVPQLFQALAGLWRFYSIHDSAQAHELGEQLLRLAQGQSDSELLIVSHWMLGTTLAHLGEFALARVQLEQCHALYTPQHHRLLAVRYGQDPGTAGLASLSRILWTLGFPDQALQRSQEALTLARERAHPFSTAYILPWCPRGNVWNPRRIRIGAQHTLRNTGAGRRHRGAQFRGRFVSDQGRTASACETWGAKGRRDSGEVFPASPHHRPKSTRQIPRTTRRHQPGPPMAISGQA